MNTLGTYHRDEASYRKEWAALTGRSEREIYVPLALRTQPAPPTPRPTDRPTGPGKDKPQPPW